MCRITFSPQALEEWQLKKKSQQEIKQALESSENPEHLAYNRINNNLVLWSNKALSVYLCSIYVCIHSKPVYDIHKSYVEKIYEFTVQWVSVWNGEGPSFIYYS